jgi:membrane protein required for colicin V production
MIWIDYTLLAIIGFSALISLFRGFVKEAISLVVWFSAIYIASIFYPDVAKQLSFSEELLANGVAIAILFISVLIIGAILKYFIVKLVNITPLLAIDRTLGLVFGSLRGAIIVSALLFCLDRFDPLTTEEEWWTESQFISEFLVVGAFLFDNFDELTDSDLVESMDLPESADIDLDETDNLLGM